MKKNKVPEKFKKIVRESIREYRNILGMNNYDGNIFYINESKSDRGDSIVYAEIEVDHRYLTADFRIFPNLVGDWQKKKIDDQKVRQVIAHEVAHLVTHNLYYLATCPYKNEGEVKDSWESLTEIIGRLTYNLSKKK